MGRLGGQGPQGPPETRETLENLVPQERGVRLATRATRGRTAILENGAALGKEDHREPQVLEA